MFGGNYPHVWLKRYFSSLMLYFNGNFTDSSKNALTVTTTGTVSSAGTAKYGSNSASFTGAGNLTVASNSVFDVGTGDFTVEMWIKPNSSASYQGLFCIGDYTNGILWRYQPDATDNLYINYNEISAYLPNVANEVYFDWSPATVAPAGEWTHVALTRKCGVIKVFANGAESLRVNTKATIPQNAVTIGQSSHSGGEKYSGLIDDLRVIKGTCLYPHSFEPPTREASSNGVVTTNGRKASLLLHFDNNLTDSSGYGHTTTAVGNAATSATQSKFGGYSLYCDGSGDRLDVTATQYLNLDRGDFTVEFWFRPASFSWSVNVPRLAVFRDASETWGLLMSQDASTSTELDSITLNHFGYNVAIRAWGCLIGKLNTWIHVAYVRHNNEKTVYVDGTPYRQNVSRLDTDRALPSANPTFSLGGNGGPYAFDAYQGYIDEVRIVKGIAVYTAPFIPPSAALDPWVQRPQATSVPAHLLLNMNGTNNSTSFTDSSYNALTCTANSDAKISTAQSKFGGSSAYFDGSGDWVHLADSPLWDFVYHGDFTLEMWVRFSSSASKGICGQSDGAGSVPKWAVYFDDADTVGSGKIGFHLGDGGNVSVDWSPSTNTWYHLAFTRKCDIWMFFVDGNSIGSVRSTARPTDVSTGQLRVGADGENYLTFDGYIDDFRIVKGHAIYQGPFAVPTAELTNSPPMAQEVKASLLLNMNGSNNSTTFTDGSSNSFTVTRYGAVISTAQSKFGGSSGYFDGVDDRLEIADNAAFDLSSTAFTVEFWFRADSLPDYNTVDGACVIAKDTYGTNLSWACIFGSGGIKVVTNNANTVVTIDKTLSNGTWYHFALVSSGTGFSVFLNGDKLKSYGQSLTNDSGNISIGCAGYNSPNSFFGGYIDDLRITRAALYCENFCPPDYEARNTITPPYCACSQLYTPCPANGTAASEGCGGPEDCSYCYVYNDGNCGTYSDCTCYQCCCCNTYGTLLYTYCDSGTVTGAFADGGCGEYYSATPVSGTNIGDPC